jgi:threonine dehydratase
MTDIAQIDSAAFRLAGHAVRTPMLASPALDAIAGRRVLIKAENLQRTGSFKFRGGWSAISMLTPDQRARGVIAYSSGNHAQGLAAAAQAHDVPAVILMPADAPPVKIANTRGYGAEVVLYNRETDDRNAIAADLAAARGLTLIPPYDHAMVIAGQGTTGLEIAEQAVEAGVFQADVLVCCSGGGLAAGTALALASRAPSLRVRTVEPRGFDDTARSLISGRIERNVAATGSICDAILATSPGRMTFPILQRLAGPGLVISDDQALEAVALAFRHLHVVLEPGGAAALAAALFLPDKVKGDAVICVASGGNVDRDLFIACLQRFA